MCVYISGNSLYIPTFRPKISFVSTSLSHFFYDGKNGIKELLELRMRLISVCKKELLNSLFASPSNLGEYILTFSVSIMSSSIPIFLHLSMQNYGDYLKKTKYFTFLLSLWLNIHCAALLGESLNNSNSEYSNARVLFNSIRPSKIQ